MACHESYIKEYEEAEMSLYRCPFCGSEREVAVTYSLEVGAFYPERFVDTICANDGEAMERVID